MAKIYVTDRAGSNPVPFLRGILTRSLGEAGLGFDQAYKVASDIRLRLGDSTTVTNDALRTLVLEHLRESFPSAVAEAYEAALRKAGNQQYQIVVIPGADHVLTPATTGCMNEPTGSTYVSEYLEILETWIQEYAY